MTKLVGYVRVSTEEQADSGLGLEAQRARIAGWATAAGVEIVEWVEDAGVSGMVAPEQRPGLGSVLERLQRRRGAREIEGVAVAKLDRLGRSTRDILRLVDDAGRRGWRLASCAESLDTESAVGRCILTILSAMVQMERDLISERTRDALAALRARGRSAGAFTPWGWRNADGEFRAVRGDRRPLVACPEEERLIEWMREQRAAGLSMHAIARELETEGVVNPRSGEARWTARRLQKILAGVERRMVG